MKNNYKITAAAVLSILSALAAVVGIVFVLKSSTASYEMAHEISCVALLAVTVVLSVVGCVGNTKLPELILDAFRWVAVVTAGAAFSYLLTDRASLLGFTYFSSLAAGNQSAMNAMNTALVAMVAVILSMMIGAVGGFFSLRKN